MKVLPTALLVLIFSIVAVAQKMTDRDLAGLKGKVKEVKVWSQEYGRDGKPVGKPKPGSETTYDDEGNTLLKRSFDDGSEYRTTYFLHKGKRVSNRMITPEPPPPNRPGQIIRVPEKYKGPYESSYKYEYDKRGRIVEIIQQYVADGFSSSTKYAYDDSGKLASEKFLGFHGGIEMSESYKYGDTGNLIETESKSRLRTEDGLKTPSVKQRYSDYTFDQQGNWIRCTVATLNKNGEVADLSVHVREITYY